MFIIAWNHGIRYLYTFQYHNRRSAASAQPGVVDRYLSAMLFAFEDLAVAHEQLFTGLQQAACYSPSRRVLLRIHGPRNHRIQHWCGINDHRPIFSYNHGLQKKSGAAPDMLIWFWCDHSFFGGVLFRHWLRLRLNKAHFHEHFVSLATRIRLVLEPLHCNLMDQIQQTSADSCRGLLMEIQFYSDC